jgi:hypothetical protein
MLECVKLQSNAEVHNFGGGEQSGERTRLACCRNRLRFANFFYASAGQEQPD